jgi:hypothetical protein
MEIATMGSYIGLFHTWLISSFMPYLCSLSTSQLYFILLECLVSPSVYRYRNVDVDFFQHRRSNVNDKGFTVVLYKRFLIAS